VCVCVCVGGGGGCAEKGEAVPVLNQASCLIMYPVHHSMMTYGETEE
jgi:hypothetical protein